MTKVKVKALRDFQSSHAGSRAKGDRFSYDVDSDPAKLIADGMVEPASKPAVKTEKSAG